MHSCTHAKGSFLLPTTPLPHFPASRSHKKLFAANPRYFSKIAMQKNYKEKFCYIIC
jgi:hypothetical protein